MKKFFGIALASIIMMGFITPVFAIDGEGSNTTDVEYVVEGSFTWSVPGKITVVDDSLTGDDYPIQVTNFNLGDDKAVSIKLINSSNYDNGFNLKKTGDNTKYPYVVNCSDKNGISCEPLSVGLNYEFLKVGANDYLNKINYITAQFAEGNTPTAAGTYTDTLTFAASIVDAE